MLELLERSKMGKKHRSIKHAKCTSKIEIISRSKGKKPDVSLHDECLDIVLWSGPT